MTELHCPVCDELMEVRWTDDGFDHYRHKSSLGRCGPGSDCVVRLIIIKEDA